MDRDGVAAAPRFTLLSVVDRLRDAVEGCGLQWMAASPPSRLDDGRMFLPIFVAANLLPTESFERERFEAALEASETIAQVVDKRRPGRLRAKAGNYGDTR